MLLVHHWVLMFLVLHMLDTRCCCSFSVAPAPYVITSMMFMNVYFFVYSLNWDFTVTLAVYVHTILTWAVSSETTSLTNQHIQKLTPRKCREVQTNNSLGEFSCRLVEKWNSEVMSSSYEQVSNLAVVVNYLKKWFIYIHIYIYAQVYCLLYVVHIWRICSFNDLNILVLLLLVGHIKPINFIDWCSPFYKIMQVTHLKWVVCNLLVSWCLNHRG